MPPDQFPSSARRADAERNRDKILAAARSAFADPEADISMAEISRRARVGMATRTAGGETPGAILVAWLHRFFAFVTSKRHIAAELLEHTDRSDPLFE